MSIFKKAVLGCVALGLLLVGLTPVGVAAEKPKFKVAWSIYAGWMPWDYAGNSKVLKKWADQYGIEIEMVRMDYLPSIEAYVAKQVDGCVMTNMECLDMPAASGVDSTAVIMGDYSNGNDAVLVRDKLTAAKMKKQNIYLEELSVSHYLLARFLDSNRMKEKDVKIVNTSSSDIGSVFITNKKLKAVVTWNPIVMEIEKTPGVSKLFTSADIPYEILDMLVVNTETLKKHPELGKALTGAWYEIMDLMTGKGPETDKALSAMAEAAGCSLADYRAQLQTTAMFYQPQAAVDFVAGEQIKQTMDFVRKFCFAHKLLGENAATVDVVGIEYPDKSIQGDKNKVKFRFTTEYMALAAQGKLRKK